MPPRACATLGGRGETVSREGQQAGPGYGRQYTIAFANEKGGVGKTTACVNIGAALARLGWRVLCVDLDPQANLTAALGIPLSEADLRGLHHFLGDDRPLADAITTTDVENLALVPACPALAEYATTLSSEPQHTGLLRRLLALPPRQVGFAARPRAP